MRADENEHRSRPYRVHELASDFELLDVWKFDFGPETVELRRFLDCFWASSSVVSKSWLGRTRVWLGRRFKWDERQFTRPIPGCSETLLSARLTAADRAANLSSPEAPSPITATGAKTVYLFADEALYEVSNDTIHALLHFGVCGTPTLAIYIKSRGAFSRIYMAAIAPFRHAIIYPALIRAVEKSWRAR